MNQQTIVLDIKAKAAERRVSIAELCRRAQIHPDTFANWQKTKRNPDPVGANLHSIERLYREIEKIDAQDAARLAAGKAVAA